MDNKKISFVVPLYNESAVYASLIERLNKIMDSSPLSIQVVLVDDGSKDNTAELMTQTALGDERYMSIFLSRNYGHQIALSAGLKEAEGSEAIMIIDGDLQDPPELFFQFYEQLKKGYDVVYAVRKKRKENIFKRAAYHLFYRLMKKIASIDIPLDSGDFALISRRVVNTLNSMPEQSRYLRGMRSWIGHRQIGVEYERQERAAGDSKYSLKMLIQLAYNGIFNFSEYPIKFIKGLGYTAVLVTLTFFIITVIKKYFWGTVPEGFTALLFTIILFSGVQLIALGLIGEYVLRIFFQVKNRPLFIIRDKINNGKFSDIE
jgi:glycosyltransferase involved in cell wall biosynthesis